MNPFTLHLLRHGAPQEPGRLHGHGDAAPSAEGIAACIARAGDIQVGSIVSSDLSRSRVPAEKIAEACGLPLRVDPRWRELDFGAWDGTDPSQLDAAALERFHDNPETYPPPGGERWSALMARVAAALDDITGDALVLAHGGAIRAALCQLMALDHRQGWAIDLPYAALVSVRLWPGRPRFAQLTGLST